jgi:hypothetical protein
VASLIDLKFARLIGPRCRAPVAFGCPSKSWARRPRGPTSDGTGGNRGRRLYSPRQASRQSNPALGSIARGILCCDGLLFARDVQPACSISPGQSPVCVQTTNGPPIASRPKTYFGHGNLNSADWGRLCGQKRVRSTEVRSRRHTACDVLRSASSAASSARWRLR